MDRLGVLLWTYLAICLKMAWSAPVLHTMRELQHVQILQHGGGLGAA